MKCVICDIVSQQTKSFKVFEDEEFIAFLDIKPLFLGHCLIAPKEHIETIYLLAAEKGNHLLNIIQLIGNAVERGMQAQGTFLAVNNTVSQSIPHLHVHVVPRKKGDGLKGFFWPRTQYESDEQFIETQNKIKKFL